MLPRQSARQEHQVVKEACYLLTNRMYIIQG